ncbi:MAG: carboxypeptidase-like regulatory domain-containing protein [Proteobacteria bacterium]|nr:carboxypeptidase-like regulatory domain-containing protein [Pseudomonadota bacterium]MBU1739186.1 carboxypeptidase-like regulatory domain-containing protein [Pseudomonadota bacterium]
MKRIFPLALMISVFMGHSNLQAAAIQGTVVDGATGEAVAEAGVVLYNEVCTTYETATGARTTCHYSSRPSVSTDDKGDFGFADLEANNYKIRVQKDPAYLPAYYDSVDEYNLSDWTIIPLCTSDSLDLGVIQLKERPFYFGEVQVEPSDLFRSGGRGKITAEVINATGRKTKMNFWALLNVTRTDDSEYYGLEAVSIESDHHKTTLRFGINDIEIPIHVPEKIAEDIAIQFSLYGGKSRWQPMLPPYRKFIWVMKVGTSVALPLPILSDPIPPQVYPDPIIINPNPPQPLPPQSYPRPIEFNPDPPQINPVPIIINQGFPQ